MKFRLILDEICAVFLDTVLEGKRTLTTATSCGDTNRICIPAEASIKRGGMLKSQ